jgi:hypothetical protein
MSWVTDVLLIFSLEEIYGGNGEALDNINAWLDERMFEKL